jgi:5S rRNA maturation endonuclease (ribonuclease M5)
MYSTKTAVTMSLKDLLSMLDDESIYTYYLGKIKLGKLIHSPLRNNDKNPSFAIFRGKEGGLFFKDHGSGDGGNSIKFVKLYNHITTQQELERELLRIVRKMNPNSGNVIRTYSYSVDSGPTDIGIVRQPFTEVDKKYWKQFHISLETLKKFQVFSIKYFLCNRVVRGTYKETNPMYAYKVYDRFKIYRPLASKYTKWRTNLTNEYVQGLAESPKDGGNLLIITKSLKDVMCLYEMGYSAIAASSETTFIPDNILSDLKRKWKNVVILYDRDQTGMFEARKYSKKYNIDTFFVHKKFNSKDISDAVKNNNFTDVKKWLNKTLEKYV